MTRAQESGLKVSTLDDRPKLLPELEWYWECFRELSRDRRISEGLPLPLTTGELYTYFRCDGVSGLVSFEEFSERLRKIDDIWLEAQYAKQDREAKARSKTAKAGR